MIFYFLNKIEFFLENNDKTKKFRNRLNLVENKLNENCLYT